MLNEMINEKMGGVSSAKIILYSVNFEEIKQLTEAGRWDEIEKLMTAIAKNLQAAGADCLLLGANTMHKIADDVQQSIGIPLLNIAEETAREIKRQKLHTVALLGTKYTMQFDFYKNKLTAQGITTIIPAEEDIEFINTAIYSEMGKGIFLPATKEKFLAIIGKLAEQGAQGIILGCTEIPILVKQSDCKVPLFDTTKIHSASAIRFALS
jgi:aspartate racemase